MTGIQQNYYGVWLHEYRVGTLSQKGDHTRFVFDEDYLNSANRPVLGLHFEQDLTAKHSRALRLPEWFSNLLPEGILRDWIARDRQVSPTREMELLAQVGHDLPGAVRVREIDSPTADTEQWPEMDTSDPAGSSPPGTWKFSLAGVALKFSMLQDRDRLTLPAADQRGDWIVKLPDREFPQVPRNEYAMMRLAALAGIDVPQVELVHRDSVDGLPETVWPTGEEWAYSIRRFDRTATRGLIHIEDLAQVRNFFPEHKYDGTFETVAALIYRNRQLADLQEFVRRLTFGVLIGNGDAHLKNWSLIYRTPTRPQLAPAYDLVSTGYYRQLSGRGEEDLALKFGGRRHFGSLSLASFDRLDARLARSGSLAEVALATVRSVHAHWPRIADENLGSFPELRADIADRIARMSRQLGASDR
ncbi:MAG: HipA domain-containing protein [Micropruina sp.]|uniref:type II toxin-antitoxin system HipA family toxin n=1 Tax=Micropruina sp. TaxID=2737536 RepID=UPI0039E59673